MLRSTDPQVLIGINLAHLQIHYKQALESVTNGSVIMNNNCSDSALTINAKGVAPEEPSPATNILVRSRASRFFAPVRSGVMQKYHRDQNNLYA